MKSKRKASKHARTTHATVRSSHRAKPARTTGPRTSAMRPAPSNGTNGHTVLLHSAPSLNGVNVNELVLMADAIQRDPRKAEYGFRATTQWVDGGHSRTRVQGFWGAGREDTSRSRSFTIESDEPAVLLGGNRGPNAVEAALSAIGQCMAVGIAYNAAAKGIAIKGIEVELEGDLDLRGFLGIKNGGAEPRPGFKDVRAVCRIKSDVPPSEIKELLDYVERTSPVLDLFRNPVPVTVELEH